MESPERPMMRATEQDKQNLLAAIRGGSTASLAASGPPVGFVSLPKRNDSVRQTKPIASAVSFRTAAGEGPVAKLAAKPAAQKAKKTTNSMQPAEAGGKKRVRDPQEEEPERMFKVAKTVPSSQDALAARMKSLSRKGSGDKAEPQKGMASAQAVKPSEEVTAPQKDLTRSANSSQRLSGENQKAPHVNAIARSGVAGGSETAQMASPGPRNSSVQRPNNERVQAQKQSSPRSTHTGQEKGVNPLFAKYDQALLSILSRDPGFPDFQARQKRRLEEQNEDFQPNKAIKLTPAPAEALNRRDSVLSGDGPLQRVMALNNQIQSLPNGQRQSDGQHLARTKTCPPEKMKQQQVGKAACTSSLITPGPDQHNQLPPAPMPSSDSETIRNSMTRERSHARSSSGSQRAPQAQMLAPTQQQQPSFHPSMIRPPNTPAMSPAPGRSQTGPMVQQTQNGKTNQAQHPHLLPPAQQAAVWQQTAMHNPFAGKRPPVQASPRPAPMHSGMARQCPPSHPVQPPQHSQVTPSGQHARHTVANGTGPGQYYQYPTHPTLPFIDPAAHDLRWNMLQQTFLPPQGMQQMQYHAPPAPMTTPRSTQTSMLQQHDPWCLCQQCMALRAQIRADEDNSVRNTR